MISIIITMIGDDGRRRISLDDTLQSLRSQTYEDVEIILVEQLLGKQLYKDVEGVRYFSVTSPIMDTVNRCWLKNYAATRARGRYLLFMDGDLVCNEDFLERVMNFHEETSYPVFITWDKMYRFKISGYKKWKGGTPLEEIRGGDVLWPRGKKFLTTPMVNGPAEGAIFFEKKFFFDEFGGWNENYFGWGYGDNDAALRWSTAINAFPVCENTLYHLPHGGQYKKAKWLERNKRIFIQMTKDPLGVSKRLVEAKVGQRSGPTLLRFLSPRIYLYGFNVGSGIERAGNLVANLLWKYNPIVYTSQNPPCILISDLVKQQPDVILLNEYYPRTITAAYYYKKCNPDVKVILLNHCYDRLTNLPIDPDKGDDILHRDGRVMINYFFNDTVDTVINLNYHPERYPYPRQLNVIDQIFPIEDKFEITKPWKDRPKDFFYYGNVIPLKFSKEFAEKCDMPLDILGKPRDEEYFREVIKNKHFSSVGFIPEAKLVERLNEYRFFVVPHSGSEPFNLCIAEAIRCGCIVLVTNKRKGPRADWIDWAKDCYVEYSSTDELLEGMKYYLARKEDEEFIKQLNEDSLRSSIEMIRRTDGDNFRKILEKVISSPLRAVIMNAGVGFGETQKCLHHVNGEMVLERMVRILREEGVDDITCVVGWKRKRVEEECKRLGIKTLFNPTWMTDSHTSVTCGLTGDGDVLLLYGDILLPEGLVTKFKDCPGELVDIHTAVPYSTKWGSQHVCVLKVGKSARELFKKLGEYAKNYDGGKYRKSGAGLWIGAGLLGLLKHNEHDSVVAEEKIQDIDKFEQTDEYKERPWEKWWSLYANKNWMINGKDHPMYADIAKEVVGKTVLDAGCCTGNAYHYLKNYKYTGVDITEKFIRGIKQRFPGVDAHVGSVLDLPFTCKFDTVICKDLLEHLHPDDVPTALSEMTRVMKERIVIGFFVPPGDEGSIKIDKGYYLNRYSKVWILEQIDKLGLEADIKQYKKKDKSYAVYVLSRK